MLGCNMAFRRAPLAALGGFSSRLGRVGSRPVGAEETEVCIRLRRAEPGHIVMFRPAARVHHLVPAARARLRYFVARCFAEGCVQGGPVEDGRPGEGSPPSAATPR